VGAAPRRPVWIRTQLATDSPVRRASSRTETTSLWPGVRSAFPRTSHGRFRGSPFGRVRSAGSAGSHAQPLRSLERSTSTSLDPAHDARVNDYVHDIIPMLRERPVLVVITGAGASYLGIISGATEGFTARQATNCQ
jgi:hypothetical protein